MKMRSPSSGVVVAALRLLLATAALSPAFGQVIITNSPSPGTVGIAYSFQFQATGATSFVYTCQCEGSPVPGLNLSSSGSLSGTPTTTGIFTFLVKAADSTNPANNSGFVLMSILIGQQPLTINTTSVPDATRGVLYNAPLSASGGTGGYSWTMTGGSLPSGLAVIGSGSIGGTASAAATAGPYNFTIKVTDSSSSVAFQFLTLTLRNAGIVLSPSVLPPAILNGAYNSGVTASGGTGGPYTYSLTGSTPPGIGFNTSTGAITGSPTSTGTFNFTIGVSDGSAFTPAFTPQNYSITVFPLITLSPSTIPSGDALSNYSQTFTATGGSGSGYSFSIIGTPPGMSFNTATGTLSGPPANGGAFAFTVTAHDSAGFTGSQNYNLLVNPALTLAPAAVPAGQVGTLYSQAFTASGGSGGYTYTFGGAAIPGLTFSGNILSGTPTTGGSYPFSVTAKDSLGFSVVNNYTLSITNSPIIVHPGSIPSGQVGAAYTQTFSATGGTGGPYTLSVTAASLFGLTFTPASATLAGTPTSSGSGTVTITASDGTLSGHTDYTLTIAPAALTLLPSSIPNGTVGTPYSQVFTATGGLGTYSFSITGTPPPGLGLTPGGGATANFGGTPTTGGSYSVSVKVTDGSSTATQNFTMAIGNLPISLAPASLPPGIVGTLYSQTFVASGGTGGPYTYTISGSTPGLTPNSTTGTLTGIPTSATTYNFTIGVSDGSAFTPAFTPKNYSITIFPAITISPLTIPSGTTGVNYAQTFTAAGGTGAGYTYSISVLPPGMAFNTATGLLSGPPSAGGTTNFSITGHDSGGFTGSQNYSLVVNAPLTLSPSTLPAVQNGTLYSQTFTASGGSGGYTYTFTGTPPPGLNFNAGVLSGTLTTAGTFPFSVTAKDSLNVSVTNNYSLVVNNSAITLGPASLPPGIVNGNYSQTFVASGGNGGPYTYAINGSTPGLTLNPTTGVLSGAPTSATTYNFTIGVSDGSAFTPAFTPKNYLINVVPLITLSPSTIPPASLLVNYSQTFTASGGSGTGYTYAISATPPGLTFNVATGLLSGPPSATGSTNFSITAHDSLGFAGAQNYTLVVNSVLTLSPSTLGPIPTATFFSQTFTATGGAGGYVLTFTGTPPPGLNFDAGVLSGTPTTPGTYAFSVTAKDSANGSVTNNYSLIVSNPSITLAPNSLPPGTLNASYSQTFVASGGNGGPFTYSITGATPGLTLNPTTGVLSGAPTSATTYNFTIGVSDGSPSTPAFTPKSYSIVVNPAITIAPTTIPSADLLLSYSQTFTASGGTGSGYVYSISTAPPGLALNATTGVLSGQPSSSGTFNFTITARDPLTLTGTSPTITLTVNPALTLAPATLSSAAVGTGYSQAFTAGGGSGGYAFTLVGTPPPGLGLNANVLSGTPTTSGTFPFSIMAKDSVGGSVTNAYSLTVGNQQITVQPPTIPAGQVGSAYAQIFTATGGTGGPYTFSIGAPAPFGLSFNAANATLSGTPTTSGTASITISATDGQLTGQRVYSLTVNPAGLTLNPSTIGTGIVGVNYSQTFTATGGSGTYTITLTSAPSPSGLTFAASAATATLSGIPTASGSFPVTVQVNDGTTTISRNYTLAISASSLSILTTSLPGGAQGSPYSTSLSATGGTPPYTWAISPGSALPADLTLTASGTGAGSITGTLASSGTFSFGVMVTDSVGSTASKTLSISAQNAPLSFTTTSPLPPALSGANYSVGLGASGGVPPYTFSLNSGPPGLSLSGSTLSGKLTNPGSTPITYNVSVRVTDSAGGSAGGGFQITVQPATAGLILSAGSLSFEAGSGGPAPAPEYVSVSSTTQASPSFTVGSDQSWLSSSPSAGTTPATLQISVNQSGLTAGTYSGTITVTGPDGPHTVSVGLTVIGQPSRLSVAPTIISFSTDGTKQPGPSGIQVGNAGDGSITFSTSLVKGGSWIKLGNSPSVVSGASPATIPVTAAIGGLAPGDYRDVVHIDSTAGSADVPVTLLVSGGPTLDLSPAGSLFTVREGQGVSNGTRSFEVLTTGTATVDWTASLLGGSGWLTLNTPSGTVTPDVPQ